jgi:predicted GNAT family N-acyltransferase
MVDVQRGHLGHAGREAQRHPQAVFVDEQKIPADMEWDAADAECLHAVAYNRLGMALATGRLLEHGPGTCQDRPHGHCCPPCAAAAGRAVLDA